MASIATTTQAVHMCACLDVVPVLLKHMLSILSLSLSLPPSPGPSLVLHLPALTLENLAGDFYVPGTNLGKGQAGPWPEIMDAWLL